MIVPHALRTSTSRMALRVTFFVLDLAPSVATSLESPCKLVARKHAISHSVGSGGETELTTLLRRHTCGSSRLGNRVRGKLLHEKVLILTLMTVEHVENNAFNTRSLNLQIVLTCRKRWTRRTESTCRLVSFPRKATILRSIKVGKPLFLPIF